ncbi:MULTISPECIES: substrate-binding domain-containing protein [unclassified Dietzia]|uniref:molybdate ABC transporter substrate-binding protein n=1 Tax=unclassified Dietzia TaxID=2617939 RepID=UPI000D203BD9|nr:MULTISPECIES: substrate-binding domain-containing protein [unclassified Dietzia]AVZ38230.1 molybdenum ABC transporter substrate-binding protein [Dietzia sp. JS16-p6b]MBB1024069.1 solute-binding protein [Dietzia sp. DQ12-76]MBB1026893.1 solute-binding protein [Dietzia sp. DQ11-38-2]QGW23218.1 ABC-type molybdate transporter, substrate- binding protein [Dietzia sp. DQ12-45-1b]
MGRRSGLALGVALMCSGVACAVEEPEATAVVSLGVAAAPSLSEAFVDIIRIFEAENPGVRVHLELGRSDEIARGLSERTDLNVFASASEEAMESAVEQGAAVGPQIFARNHVVVAVPAGNPRDVREMADLARPELRVGLCAVDTPCGKATEKVLTAWSVQPVDAVRESGGSRALTARLADGEMDVGIVYRTDVASSNGWVAPVEVEGRERELMRSAGMTRYVLARVPGGEGGPDGEAERVAADRFRELVTSDRGRRALEGVGLEPLPE